MRMNRKFKRVFLLTIDALRKDHCSIYNYERETTPNLKKLTKIGSVFMNAFTNGPDTPSSFSASLTSQYPFCLSPYSPISKERKILSEILQKNNVFTFAVNSNPNLGESFNFDKGFNIFIHDLKSKGYRSKDNERVKENSFLGKIKSLLLEKIRYLIRKELFKKSSFINRTLNFIKFNKKIRKLFHLKKLKSGFNADDIKS